MGTQEVKLGVIGTDGRGAVARHGHQPDKGARIVACCDINDQVRDKAREWYGQDIFWTKDYRELLEQDLDGVFVCTPDFLHEEHATAALSKGKGVFLEKPLAISTQGCDNIMRTAKNNNAKLCVGHNMRFMHFVLEMKRLIDDGTIGEVTQAWCRHFICYGGEAYFKDWHSERRYSNSLLLQKGCHDIDVIHYLCGGYSTRVSAMGSLRVYDKCEKRKPGDSSETKWNEDNWPPLSQKGFSPIIDVEDQNMVLMQLDNGVQAAYLQNHYTPDLCRNYTIIGTEGRLENLGDYHPGATIRVFNRRKSCYGNQPGYQADFEVDIKGGYGGGHGGADPRIIWDFVTYLKDNIKPEVPVVAARNAVAAGCAAADSLRNGSMPQDVPPVPRELRDM